MSELVNEAEIMIHAAKNRHGFVYCIRNMDSDAYKVGWSRNPFKRISALRTGNDGKLTFVGCFPGRRQDESLIHRLLSNERIRGEWFDNNNGIVLETFMRLREYAFHAYAQSHMEITA